MDVGGFVKLSDMVDGLLFKDKQLTKSDRNYVMEHMIDGIRHFKMHDCYSPKQVKVIPDTNGIINYPLDMVGFISLNYIENGEFVTLPEQRDISTSTTIVSGQETFDTDFGEGVTYDDGLNYGLGTIGGKGDTYFVRDEKKARFLINGQARSELVILYVSAGVDTEAETYLVASSKLLLEAWTRWQISEYGQKYTESEIERRRDRYEEQRRLFRTFSQSIKLNEFVDELARNYGMLPQR